MSRHSAPSLEYDGYVVIPRFLSASVADELTGAVDAVLQEPVPQGCERPHNTLMPLRWSSAVVGTILSSATRCQAIRSCSGAEDLRWISGYVSVKAPDSGALWWHQDWWCWDHPVTYKTGPPQIALLIYLDDTDEHRGALRILPGSHRSSCDLHSLLPEAHSHGDGLPQDHDVCGDHPDQVTLGVRRGDAVLLDYRVLHGTHPNRSPRRRNAILLSFTPSWRDLPSDIKAHLIQHLALPREDEAVSTSHPIKSLLPAYDGVPRDLPLIQEAPPRFHLHA